MTISNELTKLNTNMQNAYTAVDGKGGTLPSAQNFDNLATAISSIPSGGYQLHRVKDDSNNEIGTAFMEFEDANGNKYDVVCLDAQYRNDSTQWCSSTGFVTNLPAYYVDGLTGWWYDNAKETATTNTQLILDYCSAKGYTSTACTHCRSKSFTINGTTYYGQLPNMRELFEIWVNRVQIETMDTSASSYTSKNFSSARNIWASTQASTANSWYLMLRGSLQTITKTTTETAAVGFLTCPILEIPK